MLNYIWGMVVWLTLLTKQARLHFIMLPQMVNFRISTPYLQIEICLAWTLSTQFSHSGHTEIAALLIENGADVNAEFSYHYTPLTEAAYEGNLTYLTTLVNIWLVFFDIQKGHIEMMELLIKNGANVNITTSSRKNRTSTLLHDVMFDSN